MIRRPGFLTAPVVWRSGTPLWAALAAAAAVAWPPIILTLVFLPPAAWAFGPAMDWRLAVLLVAVVVMPAALHFIARERRDTGSPSTRLGVIWRFALYGGLLAAALQVLLTLGMSALRWGEAGALAQSLGATETTVLIYGVAGLPTAMLVGVSYALWAGLCVALIAFTRRPPSSRPYVGAPETPSRPD